MYKTLRIWWLTVAISSGSLSYAAMTPTETEHLDAGLSSATIPAHADADTVPAGYTMLDSLTVTAHAPVKMRIDTRGNLTLDGRWLKDGLRMGSELDLTRVMLTLPGISAGGDYASAVSVDGGDAGHNIYTVAGAKVFYPYHFGGFFSTFNNDHYPQFRLLRTGGADCIGASVQFDPLTVRPDSTHLAANIGMLSSSATLSQPITSRMGVTLSGRASYINLLYDRWLNDTHGYTTHYTFQDLGATLYYDPTPRDHLTANILFTNDNFLNGEPDGSGRHMLWHNLATSLQWRHTGRVPMRHTLHHSSLTSSLSYDVSPFMADIRSRIAATGLYGDATLYSAEPDETITLTGIDAGYSLSHYTLRPLLIAIDVDRVPSHTLSMNQRLTDAYLWGGTRVAIGERVVITPKIKSQLLLDSDRTNIYIDPQIAAEWSADAYTAVLEGGMCTQPLHLASITDIGMPSNFWISSNSEIAPERALSATATFTRTADDVFPLTAMASVFGKRLYNCIQFDSNLLNMMSPSYSLYEHLVKGPGWSTGIELSLRRTSGRLSGWASYAWIMSRRHFSATDGWVRAVGVPAHSVNLTGTYTIGRHWVISANFAYNSGRPYTPVTAVYIVNENVVMVYGRRNSATLPAYHHLDIGVTYRFDTPLAGRRVRHSLNLSIFNLYGHKNIEFISYKYDKDRYQFYRRMQESMFRFIPSLSYSIEL